VVALVIDFAYMTTGAHATGSDKGTPPEPRYFSMPSIMVGRVVVICVALSCRPMLAVTDPPSGRRDELAGADGGGVPGYGDQVALPRALAPAVNPK
jgi:hypothetical protein